jgi:hypothetical protein
MPRYNIEITPGNIQGVEANSPEDAVKIVKSSLAETVAAPYVDKIMFDYDSGVPDKQLRRLLARAEILPSRKNPFEEFDRVLDGYQGNILNGHYVRNSKGQLAITPEGMEALGYGDRVKSVELSNGDVIPQHTIIDERSFNLKTGDLSDMTGALGPVLGAVIGMDPRVRGVLGLTKLLGGRPRMERMLAAAFGSMFGEGTEEFADALQGFNLKTTTEEATNLGNEFLFGFAGQGLGEAFGAGYKLLLGKRGTTDLRQYNQIVNGRSWSDIRKLDQSYGREATEKEIRKAVKEGKVKIHAFKGVPSQTALTRPLVGRSQAVAEQVLGSKRDKMTGGYLYEELDYMLKDIGLERASLQSYLSEATKEGLDAQVRGKLTKLVESEDKVTKDLERLFNNMSEDILDINLYGDAPASQAVAGQIRNVLQQADDFISKSANERYTAVDEVFRTLHPRIDNLIQANIRQHRIPEIERMIADFKETTNIPLGSSLKTQAEKESSQEAIRVIEPMIKMMKSRDRITLQQIRNDHSQLRKLLEEKGIDTYTSTLVRKIIKKLDNGGAGTDPKYYDSIMTDFQDPKKFMAKLNPATGRPWADDILNPDGSLNPSARSSNVARENPDFNKEAFDADEIVASSNGDIKMLVDNAGNPHYVSMMDEALRTRPTRIELERLDTAVKGLREANETFAKRMEVYDSSKMKQIVHSGKVLNSWDEYQIYDRAILGGTDKDLSNIFRAAKEYDGYKNEILKSGERASDTEGMLRRNLQRRMFQDAFQEATQDGTQALDFSAFARSFNKFKNKYPNKLEVLFNGKGQVVLDTLNQINKLNPRLKPMDVYKEINKMKLSGRGLAESQPGLNFIRGLREQAEASAETLRFESNRAIADLPNVSLDETVTKIFRPGNASNINLLKETVSPEVFKSVQNSAMAKLLKKSVDQGGNGKITDLFKPAQLKSVLDSYGDPSLQAMFGKDVAQGLRSFQKSIDVMTFGEVGRGGAAGTLIAAGIAVNALNIQMLPVVAGLAIVRNAFSRPGLVKLMTKTDQGSIMQVIDAFEKAARQEGIRLVGEGFTESGNILSGILGDTVSEAQNYVNTSDAAQQIKGTVGEVIEATDDARNQLQQQSQNLITQSPIEYPKVKNVRGLDPARIDFAERLSGGRRIV